jgi:hypothetical protein
VKLTNLAKFVRTIVLTEAIKGGEGLAAYVAFQNGGNQRICALYDPKVLLQGIQRAIQSKADIAEAIEDCALECMRGAIEITLAKSAGDGPSNGAWEVTKIAKTTNEIGGMYALAFALAPNGTLISDRASMTGDAKSHWQKRFQDNTPKKALDNMQAPKTKDPNDDSRLYSGQGSDSLNYSYSMPGDKEALQSFQAAHKQTLQQAGKLLAKSGWGGGNPIGALNAKLAQRAEDAFWRRKMQH